MVTISKLIYVGREKMMFKKALKLSVLVFGLAALSACSTTTKNNANTTDKVVGGSEVETGAAGDAGGLSNPNAMVPGANQRYFFDYDKSEVHSSDLPSIKVQSQYLVSHPSAKISAQGNTDIRGSREYNMALGQRRAEAVKKVFLLDGASASQIHTMSYGAEKPVATGSDESDYAQNRRVDVVYDSH
jgi:peptidoglycan-associated lipoprotein